MRLLRRLWLSSAAIVASGPLHAAFLYDPSSPTPNGFFTPTLDYANLTYEYSAWDVFYAPYNLANYPDIFAPYGGTQISPGVWAPVPRSSVPGFPAAPGVYNPGDPYAFWDTRNATITQVGGNGAFIVGADVSGNIYSFSQVNQFVLKNTVDYGATGIGSVIFQFQTDGSTADFSSIRLVYNDGVGGEISIPALEAEYLREYQTSGGGHWSAAAGYANRAAIQWDLSDIVDNNGHPISSYRILWNASSTSMSFQKADLVTMSTYDAGIPISAAWIGGNGNWNAAANWQLKANSGLTLPQQNGNIRFQNNSAVAVNLNQTFTLGELIFESPANVNISTSNNSALKSNTGVATRENATGVYTINPNFEFGAVNFFDIAAGKVVMNGVISGSHGLVKSGQGTLELKNNNTFSGFIGIQGGTLKVSGNNTYTGNTNVVNGRLIVTQNAGSTGALGSATSDINVGADESLYQYSGDAQNWIGELLIEGDYTLSRNVALAPGNFRKRIGALNTASGAVFSGTINMTSTPTDPESPSSASGRVFITAQGAADRVVFSGSFAGGHPTSMVTLDGLGTVVYSGSVKAYGNSTTIQSGTLQLAAGSGYSGPGAITVKTSGRLVVDGTLSGSGALNLEGGTLTGTGTVSRGFTVNGGTLLSPGNRVGKLQTSTEEWGSAGRLRLEISNAVGGGAVGWDLLEITGALNITANSTSKFTLELATLNSAGLNGLATNFNGATDYSWKILTTTTGINGFDPASFVFDLTGFQNATPGFFSLSRSGQDLYLNYAAVPEPSSALFLGLGAFALLRRARRSQP